MLKTLFISVILCITVSAASQETENVNLIEYIKEVQKWNKQSNEMTLSFWIPNGYWELALKDNPQITQAVINQIKDAFKDYVFVCALDLDINNNGTMSYTPESDLRKTIFIKDNTNKQYDPLDKEEISSDALSLSEAIKPMFAQMLGQMGAGMHFYFFKITDEKGNPTINEYKKGEFTICHSGREFKYNLPLVTLLPPKVCPIDNASMKGNWDYCPFHGVKL